MRRARSSALVLLAAVFALAGACSTSTAPLGKGNDFTSDVDAGDATEPQQGDDGSYDDGYFARVDSGYPAAPDGYAPYSWCTQCGCPAGTYCFGGGTGVDTFDGTCHPDAGVLTSSAGLSVGCYPLPACAGGEPICDCIIAEVSQYVACYPNCSDTTNIVYCPHP
jgi:hypothetical protein